MKKRVPNKLEKWRITKGQMASTSEMGFNGAFLVAIGRHLLSIVCSDQLGWDHVSVSLPYRCPSWNEMCAIKDLFFDEEETVIQYHPPKSMYVNNHPFTLHLWRKQNTEIELPPLMMV